MKENSGFDLESSKRWYTDAVENALIQRGLTREEALAKMQESGYYEKMERFPYVQLHYDVEAAADEIQYGDDLYAGGGPERSI